MIWSVLGQNTFTVGSFLKEAWSLFAQQVWQHCSELSFGLDRRKQREGGERRPRWRTRTRTRRRARAKKSKEVEEEKEERRREMVTAALTAPSGK